MKISPIANPATPSTPANPGATTRTVTFKTQQSPSKAAMPDLRPGFTSLRQQQAADLAASKQPIAKQEPAYLKNAKQFGSVPPPPMPKVEEPIGERSGERSEPTKALVTQDKDTTDATSQTLNPQQVAQARREQTFRKAQQQLKADKEAFDREKASYISKQSLESDTLKTLFEAGISYDKLVELQLSQTPPSETQSLKAELDALKAELNSVKGEFTTRDQKAYDQAVGVIRKDAELLVDSNPAYETIKAFNESNSVVELIQKVFDQEGTILSVEDAANLVEETLLERKESELKRLTALSKYKAKQEAAQAAASEPAEPTATKATPTLTNRAGISRPLTAVERAILAYRGDLK